MRVPVVVGCAVVALGFLVGVTTPYGKVALPAARTGPTATPAAAQPLLRAASVTMPAAVFRSWALLDTRTGKLSGSDTIAATSDTLSMVKAWLAADHLRLAAQRRERPSTERLDELSIMIRDSDNEAAEDIFRRNGGTASIQRLIRTCGLTDSSAVPGRWSETRMSARDAVRMGACLADGRAAGPQWTSWVLDEMRRVRGDGRFGIVKALPAEAAAKTAIKNGWLLRDTDGLWHVNCLAVGDGWALAVMLRYQPSLGFPYGGAVCEQVTRQLLNPAATVRASPPPT
ncbi:serine hydrolase [Planosporangium sp. 12N6]|uniref:serine hydrolase n=1 Tax=Planosporangium spinosum TaxID=3402278 RepID=UPI003CF05F23